MDDSGWLASAGSVDPSALSSEILNRSNPTLIDEWHRVEVPANLDEDKRFNNLPREVWYLKTFILPEQIKEHLALRLGEITDRDRVYFNGTLIGQSGIWDSSAPQAYDRHRIYDIPDRLLRHGKINVILVNVQRYFPDEIGILKDRTEIGPYNKILYSFYLNNFTGMFFLIGYVTASLFFVFLFLRRSQEKQYLFFAIYTFSLVLYYFMRNQLKYELNIEFLTLKRIEYLALFSTVPLFFLFIRNYFQLPENRLVFWGDRAMAAAALAHVICIVYLFTNDSPITWNTVNMKFVQPVLWPIMLIGAFAVIIYRLTRNDRDAIFMLTGMLIILTGMIIDILTARGYFNIPRILGHIFFLFIVSLALILANQFIRMGKEIEEISKNLQTLRLSDLLIRNATEGAIALSMAAPADLALRITGELQQFFNLKGAVAMLFQGKKSIILNSPAAEYSNSRVENIARKYRRMHTLVTPALLKGQAIQVFMMDRHTNVDQFFTDHSYPKIFKFYDEFRKDLFSADFSIYVPVYFEEELLACFFLGQKKDGTPFTERETDDIVTVSGILAVTLKHNRVFQELDHIRQNLTRENAQLQESTQVILRTVIELSGGKELIIASNVMNKVLEDVKSATNTDATILILGESGTGKELIASMVHESSHRSKGPFIGVNCAAIPETLIESELFGYEKGAFTGATASRDGVFQQADGGTLFLDEVGEIPLPLQVRLLRALQERKVMRLGGKTVSFDARIIAATNRDLESLVQSSMFRQDLYFRLNVIPITLPPLRERTTEILALVQHYLERFSKQLNRPLLTLSNEAVTLLNGYEWPGNVRELENVVLRAVVNARETVLRARDFPALFNRTIDRSSYALDQRVLLDTDEGDLLKKNELATIRKALTISGNNKSRAARVLGLSRSTFYEKLKKYNIT